MTAAVSFNPAARPTIAQATSKAIAGEKFELLGGADRNRVDRLEHMASLLGTLALGDSEARRLVAAAIAERMARAEVSA